MRFGKIFIVGRRDIRDSRYTVPVSCAPVSTLPNPTDFSHSFPWIAMKDPIPSAVETLTL